MKKSTFGILAAFCLGAAQGATWTGGGDGVSWDNVGNWGGALPAAGEAITVASDAALAIQCGATDHDVGNVTLSGKGTITFSGTGTLSVGNINTTAKSVFDCPVALKEAGNRVICEADAAFKKPVTSIGLKSLQFRTNDKSASIHFYDTFTGADTTIFWAMGWAGSSSAQALHFHGKVTAKYLGTFKSYKSGWCYLYASDNDIGQVSLSYSSLVFMAPNCLPATVPLDWANEYCESAVSFGSYDLHGNDQTVCCLDSTWIYSNAAHRDCRHVQSSTGTATLTLKGTRDAATRAKVHDGVSVVWDPTGDFTQTFVGSQSPTTEKIVVKGGTVCLTNGATFASLSRIDVEAGATFNLATEAEAALSELTALNVAAGGTFKVAASSTRAFADEQAAVRIAAGGKLDLAEDVVFAKCFYDDVKLAAGVYRGADGTGDGTAVDWISGTGRVTVRDYGEKSREIRTWTGAGDGKTWTDDANWDTAAPFSEDSAVFNSSAAITSGLLLDGPRKITVAQNCTVSIAGEITGAGDMTKVGAGTLELSGSNTFTGSFFINAGQVIAHGANALGDNAYGAVDVTKKSETTSYNLVLDNVTVRKNLIVRNIGDANNSYRSALNCKEGTTNVVLGALDAPNEYLRMNIEKYAQFVVAGGGTFATAQIMSRDVGADFLVVNKPIVKRVYDDNAGGTMTFSCVGNTYAYWGNNSAHNRGVADHLRLTVNGALTEDSVMNFGKGGWIELFGTTQAVGRIAAMTQSDEMTLVASGTISSDKPAQLALCGAGDYTNSAVFKGDVTLVQRGGGTLFLTAASTSTGALVAESGDVVLMEGANWGGSISAKNGTVTLPTVDVLKADDVLTLGEGGTLVLPAGECVVAGIVGRDGNPVAPGRYSAVASEGVTALAGLAGEGVVTVLPGAENVSTYTWTGMGGDGLFSTAANWEGGTAPDFAALGDYVFPGNGYTTTVDVAVYVRKAIFPAEEAGGIGVAASGAGALTFVNGALCVTSAAAVAKSVLFSAPVTWAGGLSVRAGDPARKTTGVTELAFEGRLSTLGEAAFVKDGYGTLRFKGDDNDVVGDFVVSNGFTYVSGANPLGGSGKICTYLPDKDENTKLCLDGCTINRDVWFTHQQDNNRNMLTSTAGSTNWINGLLQCANHHFRVQTGKDSMVYCAGGVLASSFFLPYGDGTGCVVITNVPARGGRYWNDAANASKCVFAVAGNNFGTGAWNVYNTVETQVDDCFVAGSSVQFSYWSGISPYGMLDLRGTKQTLAGIWRSVTPDAAGVVTTWVKGKVTGEAGSLLTLNGSAAVEVLPTFIGAASLKSGGTATRTLRNCCTSTGDLTVAGGTLVMAAPGADYKGVAQTTDAFEGGSWAGLRVEVSGGTLKLDHAKAISKYADVHLAGGKVEIADGVTVYCQYIYDANGKKLARGTYRAADLPDAIAGNGALRALGDRSGTVLVVR